ncbi:MAG: hypothetical protein HY301_04085 [Verrucomicrobia bacterium]|nr:hypothetical protein [Verrucomicrobiota bacterium]
MKLNDAIFHPIAVLSLALLTGCFSANIPSIPRADNSVDVERQFDAPFDVMWDRLQALAKNEGMKVITTDKSSGVASLASKSIKDGQYLYYNVLMKERAAAPGTIVYVFQRRRHGSPVESSYDSTFLERLNKTNSN